MSDLEPAEPGAGTPASPPPQPVLTKEAVLEALRHVVDPEIRISIVDLGLIYGVEIDDGGKRLNVRMTLTTPMCPYGPLLLSQVQDTIQLLPGTQEARVTLVWEPPWNPREMASDEAKDLLGIW